MPFKKFIANLSHLSFGFLKKFTDLLDAVFSGFWLGVMNEKSLALSDELYYNRTKYYREDKYNESGLFDWEKPVIQDYFSNAKKILLLAAGGGRESLALSKIGFDVTSYECNPALIEYGNNLLQKNGIESKIKYLPRNSVPGEIKKFDGIIIGWGAYSLIQGKKQRLSFLNGLYPFLGNDALLMISFLYMREKGRKEKIIKNISNFFRFFTRKGKTELGDKLVPNFIHYFTEEEIKSELIQAKFRVIDYRNAEYGCLVAAI